MFSNTIKRMRNYNEGRADTTLHADLLWTMLIIAATAVIAFVINQYIINGTQPLVAEFLAGMVHAIMYLQALTLMVLAFSYLSPTIKDYRGVIMTLLPIGIYVTVRIVTDPEPVAVMYSYGAAISILGIAMYKVSSLIHYLYATVWCPDSLQADCRHRRSTDGA